MMMCAVARIACSPMANRAQAHDIPTDVVIHTLLESESGDRLNFLRSRAA